MNTENKLIWNKKGATLSVKNASNEYGITQDEIINAINEGKFQYRLNYVHGNPYYKLIRNEVESYVKSNFGDSFFEKQKQKTELDIINKQLRKHRSQIKLLEKRKSELESD